MRGARISQIVLASALVCVGIYMGCTSTDFEGDRVENKAPRVWLSSAPPEGSTDKYTIQMFWGGWDPDGEIAYYEFSITDNDNGPFDPADTMGSDKWHRVYGNDSVFTFSADELVDTNTTNTVSAFTRSHTFFIRAVDEEALPSLEPAYRSFTALTLSPKVVVDIPKKSGLNPALLPPISTYRWTATDFVFDLLTTQDPESVQWALTDTRLLNEDWRLTIDFLRKTPGAIAAYEQIKADQGEIVDGEADSDAQWSPWTWYRAPDDSGKFWTTSPVDFGPYVFAIRAKDEAGAITPVLDENQNVRRVRVSNRATGPTLTLVNEFLGSVITSVCSTPVAILDVPAGVPLDFEWFANADSYGGIVSGYRYGWDIADLNDPTQWETDFTPFTATRASAPTRVFFNGTHVFSAEVIDNSGFCSRVEVKVNVVQFTMQRSLLVVDDFKADESTQAGWFNARGNGAIPNDQEHDDFWVDMVSNVVDFNAGADMIEVDGENPVRLQQVASYKSIIWSVFTDSGQIQNFPLMYQYVQFRQKNPTVSISGKREPNMLALFMAAGGHVLITGRHPMTTTINRNHAPGVRYPFITLYDYDTAISRQDRIPDTNNPVGDQSFGYKEMCIETIDFAILGPATRRDDDFICSVASERPIRNDREIQEGMRVALSIDPAFPQLELRPETATGTKAYAPSVRAYEAEMYNTPYFFNSCIFAQEPPYTVRGEMRDCFEPIYGLSCLKTTAVTFGGPVAFWTSTYADRVAELPPDAVMARSAVYGFPPVYFKPSQVKPGIEHILFCEWQLVPNNPITCP